MQYYILIQVFLCESFKSKDFEAYDEYANVGNHSLGEKDNPTIYCLQ